MKTEISTKSGVKRPRRQKPGFGKNPVLYLMRLYVAGAGGRSRKAITNLRALCDTYLRGRYELKVVDVFQQPSKASEAQIIAAPTLIRLAPLPLRRFIGDMSDSESLLKGLELSRPNPGGNEHEHAWP